MNLHIIDEMAIVEAVSISLYYLYLHSREDGAGLDKIGAFGEKGKDRGKDEDNMSRLATLTAC